MVGRNSIGEKSSQKIQTEPRSHDGEEGELFCVDIGGSNSVVLCQRLGGMVGGWVGGCGWGW